MLGKGRLRIFPAKRTEFCCPLSTVLYGEILKPEETTMVYSGCRTSPVNNHTSLKLKEAELDFHFH